MDIPDDLNKLMAELKRVATRRARWGQTTTGRAKVIQISFLSQYGFAEDVVIERIEITEQGVFQFYLFAAWQPETEELSLFQMSGGS